MYQNHVKGDVMIKRLICSSLVWLWVLICMMPSIQAADLLPSWNDTDAKQAIVSFVDQVTEESGPNYVDPADRIAVFDNDGTLWAEQPVYFQLLFARDRILDLVSQHPEWREQEPFASLLDGDLEAVLAGGEESVLEIIAASHGGMTTDEFSGIVREWIATATHPSTQRPYNQMVYQPMLELLDFLRAHGFKTYIVSGGGSAFMRPWAGGTYGIPPEQVIGSSVKTKFKLRDGAPVILRLPELEFLNDKAGKPVAINKHIGRKPLFAFGNSDGDLEMLQWTASGPGLRFMGLVHHTDARREWAYDRQSHVGRLDTALDVAKQQGWLIVDMKREWNQIFPTGR